MDLERLYTKAFREFSNGVRIETREQPHVLSAETKMLTIMLLEHRGYKCADMRRAAEKNLMKAYSKAELGLPLVFKFLDDAEAAVVKECGAAGKDTGLLKPDMDSIVEQAWSGFSASLKAKNIADIPADCFDSLVHPLAQAFFLNTGDECKFLDREASHDLRMLYSEHISKDKGIDLHGFKIVIQILYKNLSHAMLLEKGIRGQMPGRN